MDIVIYSIPGCSHCRKMKELMVRADVPYQQIVVGKDIDDHVFKEKYPDATSYPYTIIDGEPIGGLVDAVKLFVEKGLVSSTKKRN